PRQRQRLHARSTAPRARADRPRRPRGHPRRQDDAALRPRPRALYGRGPRRVDALPRLGAAGEPGAQSRGVDLRAHRARRLNLTSPRHPVVGAVAALLCSAALLSYAAETRDADTWLDGAWNPRKTPGVAATVARGGRIVFASSRGLADLENDVPM